jgi:hypothetical protein
MLRRTVPAALVLVVLLPFVVQAQAPGRADNNKAIARR